MSLAETQVNTTTDKAQQNASVTALDDGGYVVIWESDDQDGDLFGVYGQRYDANGNMVGGEFAVNTTTAKDQMNASVAALSDGGFIVTYQSKEQDGNNFGVFTQRFDSSGNKVGGEVQVNTTTDKAQQNASVTALDDGGYVVIWESDDQDGDLFGVYGQRYDANGNMVGGEFAVNTTTAKDQMNASVAALSDGGFIVTYQSKEQDGDVFGVYARQFSSDGTAASGEILVNTTTAKDQINSAVTVLSDDSIVIAYDSNDQDGNDYGVFARKFDTKLEEIFSYEEEIVGYKTISSAGQGLIRYGVDYAVPQTAEIDNVKILEQPPRPIETAPEALTTGSEAETSSVVSPATPGVDPIAARRSALLAAHSADYRQGIANVAEASAIVDAAQKVLDQIETKLTRLQELAADASLTRISQDDSVPTALSDQERAHLNIEFEQLRRDIDTLVDDTVVNGIEALGGFSFSVALGGDAPQADNVTISLASARPADLATGFDSDDIATLSNATASLTNVTTAIDTLGVIKASARGAQSRLGYAANNLATAAGVLEAERNQRLTPDITPDVSNEIADDLLENRGINETMQDVDVNLKLLRQMDNLLSTSSNSDMAVNVNYSPSPPKETPPTATPEPTGKILSISV